ncbi:hypothetical protein AB0O28_34855 [Microbispora sp. NPDC088329]|uniref:carboxylate-amine ligase n=1 Tax=Microbispora sp. NPDC088329 TaxID=3154869 RepID=UPI00341D7BA8
MRRLPRVDDIVLIAGLFRALVRRELDALAAGGPPPATEEPVRTELVRAASWRAARSGLDGELIDPVEGVPRPARTVVGRMLEELRPQLEESGDWALVSSLAGRTLADGGSAARQREAFRRGGRLTDVVDLLLEETRSGNRRLAAAGR